MTDINETIALRMVDYLHCTNRKKVVLFKPNGFLVHRLREVYWYQNCGWHNRGNARI